MNQLLTNVFLSNKTHYFTLLQPSVKSVKYYNYKEFQTSYENILCQLEYLITLQFQNKCLNVWYIDIVCKIISTNNFLTKISNY